MGMIGLLSRGAVQGNSFPKPNLLLKIANTLDVDIRDLFYSTKTTENPSEKIQSIINDLEDLKKSL